MYRLAVFLLAVFCLTVLVEIVAVVVWRDYQENGSVSLVRALGGLVPERLEVQGTEAEVSSQPAAPATTLPEIRSELLYLINSERVFAQVPPLSLSSNASAQQHTESMMSYGYRSHWDVHGMTPQMRYTMAGGTNRIQQNIAGPVQVPSTGEPGLEAGRAVTRQVHQEFMSRPGERANVLDPWHRKVSLGLSCDGARCWIVQQFETDHLSFSTLPIIFGTMLEMAGELKEDLELESLAVWYHPHPRRLSLGQLDATYRYGYGQRPATFVRPPTSSGKHYRDSLVSYEWDTGIDPYTLDPGLPRSSAPPLAVEVALSAAVPWTTAALWTQEGQLFAVEADLSNIIATHGTGVYTVQAWASRGTERVPLTNYALFVP